MNVIKALEQERNSLLVSINAHELLAAVAATRVGSERQRDLFDGIAIGMRVALKKLEDSIKWHTEHGHE